MQVQLSAEDIINEQRRIIGDLQHELMMQSLINKKLTDKINEYETAEAARNAVAASDQNGVRRLSAAVETTPGTEAQQTPAQPA